MKTHHVIPAAGMSLNALPKNHVITACHNLRPIKLPSGRTALQPTGKPHVLDERRLKPLTTITCGGRRLLVASESDKIHVIDPTPPETAASATFHSESCKLSGDALCALADGNMLTVMTANKAHRFSIDDYGRLTEIDLSALPSISLTAETVGDSSTTIGERKLSQAYPSGKHSLAPRDLTAVTEDLRTAYRAICRQAAAAGTFVAPALCRYRVTDTYGSTIYLSPPLLLGPSDSSRLTAPFKLKSSDRQSVEAWQMAMPTWRPAITINGELPEALQKTADRIEVIAVSGLHPYDSTEKASVTITEAGGDKEFLRATMPGAWKCISSGNPSQGASRLSHILASAHEDNMELIATMSLSHSDTSATVCAAADTVDEQCKKAERLATAKISTADNIIARLSPPHFFTAGCVASLSGTEIWGRLSAHRCAPPSAESLAATKAGAGAWHASVTVNFAGNDEQLVAVSEGLSGAPLTFNPLLSYPSPDATSMTITVSSGGEVRRATFPLSADPSHSMSLYIHPSLEPHRLTGIAPAFVIPVERRVPRPMDSFVCTCHTPGATGPRRPESIATVSDGRVSAIWPCGRLNTGWDSSSLRFIIFSDSGTHRASISTRVATRPLTLTLIDSDAVNGDHAATMAEGQVVASVGRRIVSVSAGSMKTLVSGIAASAIAYVSDRHELWLSDGSMVKVIDMERMESHSRDETMLEAATGSYALLGGALCDLSRETARSKTYVRWSGCMETGDSYRRVTDIAIDLHSESVDNASLTVRRLNHTQGADTAICRLSVNGRVSAPVSARCVSLPTRACMFDFQARVSADTSITSIKTATE